MDVVYEILLNFSKILFFVLVFFAFLISGLILFKPQRAAELNSRFNRAFSTEKVGNSIDHSIDINHSVMKHRLWVGALFLLGSLFTLKYLLRDFDEQSFIGLVLKMKAGNARVLTEILVVSLKWVMILTSLLGVLICGILLFAPNTFIKINERLDQYFCTRHIQDKLNSSYDPLDGWVLRNHTLVGVLLFLGSAYVLLFVLLHLM